VKSGGKDIRVGCYNGCERDYLDLSAWSKRAKVTNYVCMSCG
jgi:hypothetical protein